MPVTCNILDYLQPNCNLIANIIANQLQLQHNDHLANLIQHADVTVTTNANGLSLIEVTGKTIFFAYVNESGANHKIVLIDHYGGGSYNYGVKVLNGTDLSPVASASVPIRYYYF